MSKIYWAFWEMRWIKKLNYIIQRFQIKCLFFELGEPTFWIWDRFPISKIKILPIFKKFVLVSKKNINYYKILTYINFLQQNNYNLNLFLCIISRYLWNFSWESWAFNFWEIWDSQKGQFLGGLIENCPWEKSVIFPRIEYMFSQDFLHKYLSNIYYIYVIL